MNEVQIIDAARRVESARRVVNGVWAELTRREEPAAAERLNALSIEIERAADELRNILRQSARRAAEGEAHTPPPPLPEPPPNVLIRENEDGTRAKRGLQ